MISVDVCEKDMFGILLCSCENWKYVVIIMHNLFIMCDEVTESYNKETKTIPTNFNEKKATFKMQYFYLSLAFLLITVALLITVSIYCYLIKYQAIQEHLLRFQVTNNEFKQVLYWLYKSKPSNKVKDIDITNRIYYFFKDIINMKSFDANNIKIAEKSCKDILIYYMGYVMV